MSSPFFIIFHIFIKVYHLSFLSLFIILNIEKIQNSFCPNLNIINIFFSHSSHKLLLSFFSFNSLNLFVSRASFVSLFIFSLHYIKCSASFARFFQRSATRYPFVCPLALATSSFLSIEIKTCPSRPEELRLYLCTSTCLFVQSAHFACYGS